MSEKQEADSIRISQVLAAALAAVTAALVGSTMGVAGTVIGAGLASIVSTIGGALYLRSIQRTKQGVRSVRNKVVARAGATKVTLTDGEPEPEAEPDEEQPPPGRRIGWPAVIVGSVLAFVLGMMVVTGIEWVRGEPLSGGEGTTVGDIVRTHPGGGGDGDDSPAPPTRESTVPTTTGDQTVTVTPTPTPTSGDQEPSDPPSSSSAPDTSTTTTGGPPSGSGSAPPPDNAG